MISILFPSYFIFPYLAYGIFTHHEIRVIEWAKMDVNLTLLSHLFTARTGLDLFRPVQILNTELWKLLQLYTTFQEDWNLNLKFHTSPRGQQNSSHLKGVTTETRPQNKNSSRNFEAKSQQAA